MTATELPEIPVDPADTTRPDEVYERHGETVALFGQAPGVPYGQPIDPIQSVYASDRGIEISEYPYSLDDAERYAQRILNAVRWQRTEQAQRRAEELNALARGAATTHSWHQPDQSTPIRCGWCRTKVFGGEHLLAVGAVPECGARCRQPWHEISGSLRGEPGDSKCIFCSTVYTATAESERVR